VRRGGGGHPPVGGGAVADVAGHAYDARRRVGGRQRRQRAVGRPVVDDDDRLDALPAQAADAVGEKAARVVVDDDGGDVVGRVGQVPRSSAKYEAVRARPSRSGISGCQPSTFWASEMSGLRRAGSSTGRASNTISDDELVSSTASCASSRIEYSSGLPMFMGPT